MYSFSYPGQKKFVVTPQTLIKTPHTFCTQSGIWEPESIEYFYRLVEAKHNNKNAIIVDIGAQTGLYTLYAKYLPDCRFHAFEPFKDTYHILLDNLAFNNIQNVTTYNCALGEKKETKLLHVPDHLGLNTFGDKPLRFSEWKDVEVQVERLDDIFLDKPSMDYIKCDTEGWEYHVLKGGEESIRKWKPEIFMEVNQENLAQCNLIEENVVDYVRSLGYTKIRVMNNENVHFTYSGS